MATLPIWELGEFAYDERVVLDKKRSVRHYVLTMLNRTTQMFEYDGLPDTIPQELLEMYLQVNGHACVTKIGGDLYALCGALGGAPDPYYRATLYTVANPALAFSGGLRILNHLKPHGNQKYQGECVLIKNDTHYQGLMYMFNRYAAQMTENDISIRSAQINSRQQTFITASTDTELKAAKAYLDGIEGGEIAAVMSKPFAENAGVHADNLSVQSANVIIQLIELGQYLKTAWYNDMGINTPMSMKREYISEEELQESTDILLPLVDDMLHQRELAVSLVNETYGTNITVKKNSAWENKEQQVEVAKRREEGEVKAIENSSDSGGTSE